MTRTGLAVVACGAVFTVSLAAQAPVKVELKDAQGQAVGVATVSADGAEVSIALDVKGLKPGEHAVHVHSVAKCEAPNFASAGPHFNPQGKKHGLQNPDGPHAGDMNNFMVGADGTAKATVTNPRVTLGPGANSLFASGGAALVIHAGADDMKTDPAGAAGDRVACGTLTK